MDKDLQVAELQLTVERLAGRVHALETLMQVLYLHLPDHTRHQCSRLLDGDSGWIGAEAVSPDRFAAIKLTLARVMGGCVGSAVETEPKSVPDCSTTVQ